MHPVALRISALFLLMMWLLPVRVMRAEQPTIGLLPITPPLRVVAHTGPIPTAVASATSPVGAELVPVEPQATTRDGACCSGAPCQPYYRNRPKGCKKEDIKVLNRSGEPDWYRYYRCVHFGYHPTQWHPWPEGWLTCRYPIPGKHPYDIVRPKPGDRTMRREERLLRPEPERLPGEDLPPQQLPPPRNTTPPPTNTDPGVPETLPETPPIAPPTP